MKQIILFLLVSLLLVSPVLAYSVPDDTIVYVTPSGTKYHRKDCSHTTTVTSLTIQDAEARGYEPCSRCNPDIFLGEYIPPDTSHSSSGSSSHSSSSPSSGSIDRPVDADQSKEVSETDPVENSESNIEPETSSRSDPWFSRVISDISDFSIGILSFFSPLLMIIINSSIGWLVVILLATLLFYIFYLLFRFVSYLCKSFSIRSKKFQKSPLKSHQKSKPKREPELYYVCINNPYYHRKDCPLLRDGELIVAVKFRTVFLDNTPPCPYCKPRDNYVDPSVYSK